MLDRSEVMLHFVAHEETSELMIYELHSIVDNHEVCYSETGENISPDKLLGLCHYDGG